MVAGGDYDLTTPEGRLSTRIVGAVARKESEDRSRRVRRKHLEPPSRASPPGNWDGASAARRSAFWSGRRPSAVAGHGLITIARDWNRRGVPSPSGRTWKSPTLRKALLASRLAGLREQGGRSERQDAWRTEPRRVGGGARPPDMGAAPSCAAESRAKHERADAMEVPAQRPHPLRRVRRRDDLPAKGPQHEAVSLRRSAEGPSAGDRGGAGRRPGRRACPPAADRPSFREALVVGVGEPADRSVKSALADLGNAQLRLQRLDDDFYVRAFLRKGGTDRSEPSWSVRSTGYTF